MEFTERMQHGRDAAAARRHKGLHTGKSAKGWDFKRGEEQSGTWWHAVAVAKCNLGHAIAFAQQDYLRVAFPERFDVSDLPF